MKESQLLQKRDSLNKFLKQDPLNQSLTQELIHTEFQLGQFDSALDLIDTLIDQSGEQDSLLFQKTNLLLGKGSYKEALEILNNNTFSQEAYGPVEINKAHANFQMGNFEKVNLILTTLNDYLEPSVYMLHARSLHHLGLLEDGVQLLKKGLSKYPNNSDMLGLISLLLVDLGSYGTEALDFAERALSKKTDQLESLLSAGMLQQQYKKDLEKSEAYFTQAVQKHPNVGRGWLYKGLAVMMKKDIEGAEKYLQKACELMPEHIGSWHALGWNLLLQKRISESRSCYEAAMKIDRNFAETHGGLSIIEAMEGNFELAQKNAKVALKLDPNSFSARYTQIILAETNQEPEKIQEIINKVFSTEQGTEALDFINIIQNNKNQL